MATIKFERVAAPTGSVSFTFNPIYGDYSRTLRFNQVNTSSAGKKVFVYDKENPNSFIRLKFTNIPTADITSFLTFINDVIDGSNFTFTFTDFDGTTKIVRLWNADDIVIIPLGDDRESLTVLLRIE